MNPNNGDLEYKRNQWEDVYSRGREKLPWLGNPIPMDILSGFCNRLNRGDKVLDYGCGDGILAELLLQKGMVVVCSDISQKALDLVVEKNSSIEIIRANEPKEISTEEKFEGVLVWGVMHHIDKDFWDSYVIQLLHLTKKDGYILFGGHSMRDQEFANGFRTSPTTGEISTAIDSLENMLYEKELKMIDSGYFEFTEGFTAKARAFKYFLVQK